MYFTVIHFSDYQAMPDVSITAKKGYSAMFVKKTAE
jgi:hypothetical protein